MTTMNTSDDFIRLLRDDPGFRRTVRREILTEELLEVPNRLSAVERGIEALLESNAALQETTAGLLETTAGLQEMTTALQERTAALQESNAAINRRLDMVEKEMKLVGENVNRLDQTVRRQTQAQSSFRGNYAQDASIEGSLGIASLFADRHSLPSHMVEVWQLGRNTLRDIVRDHEQELLSLNLSGAEGALRSFRRPDLIAGVKHLAADEDAEPEYYITMETSYIVDEEDLVRATDNARIIQHVTGRAAYAVVTGVRLKDGLDEEMRQKIYDSVEQFIQASDPEAAYWHRLYSADLRPDEARWPGPTHTCWDSGLRRNDGVVQKSLGTAVPISPAQRPSVFACRRGLRVRRTTCKRYLAYC